MSASSRDFKGPFVVVGNPKAKPGKADELAQWFANLQARANSDLEPGILKYEILRLGDEFVAFEEYADNEALHAHVAQNPIFQQFMEVQDTLMEPITPLFWPQNSLPKPTIQPGA